MTDIELVIKLPEETYNFLKKYGTDGGICENAILNGIPLPKGHGDLKDVNEILSTIHENIENAKRDKTNYCNAFENNGEWCAELWSIEDIIDNAPAIIKADNESEAAEL